MRHRRYLLFLLLSLGGCSEDSSGPSRTWTADTLQTGLEYPQGLWVTGDAVYLTQTASRNTTFGGKLQLDKYVLSTGAFGLLVDHPANSDHVVVTDDGNIYLASYLTSLPGDVGAVSVVDGTTLVETPITGLEIAVTDMTLVPSGDIYIVGASDTPAAASVYRLSANDYADTTVIKRGLGRSSAMARNGPQTFFADLAGIKRLDAAGNVTPVLARAGITSLAVAGEFLYFADLFKGEIGRVRLTGGETETVMEGLDLPQTIRYDPGSNSLYWLSSGTVGNEFKDGILGAIRELN